MLKYLFSRVLLIFIIKFFFSWGFNISSQFEQFFDISLKYHWYLETLSGFLTLIVFVIGIIFLNLSFLLLRLTNSYSFIDILEKINQIGFINSIKIFFKDFITLLNDNFNFEWKIEKYPNLFLVITFIFLSYSKGNPLLNNYYGIYKEYEIVGMDSNGNETTDYEEKGYYIIEKDNLSEITTKMKSLANDVEEDEEEDNSFEVKKRGYLFFQSALIDGYVSYSRNYNGLGSYFECLLFNGFEKFINVILYFLTPFLILITIYHYNNKEKKDDSRKY
jgi:hypothetical protein